MWSDPNEVCRLRASSCGVTSSKSHSCQQIPRWRQSPKFWESIVNWNMVHMGLGTSLYEVWSPMYKSQIPSPTQSPEVSLQYFYHHRSMYCISFYICGWKKTTYSCCLHSFHSYETCDYCFIGIPTIFLMYIQNIEMMLIVVLHLKEVKSISKNNIELREGRWTRKPKSFELIFKEYVNFCSCIYQDLDICAYLRPCFGGGFGMNMRKCVLIHTRVALTWTRSSSVNVLVMYVDLYGIAHSIASIIVIELCEANKNQGRALDLWETNINIYLIDSFKI